MNTETTLKPTRLLEKQASRIARETFRSDPRCCCSDCRKAFPFVTAIMRFNNANEVRLERGAAVFVPGIFVFTFRPVTC